MPSDPVKETKTPPKKKFDEPELTHAEHLEAVKTRAPKLKKEIHE